MPNISKISTDKNTRTSGLPEVKFPSKSNLMQSVFISSLINTEVGGSVGEVEIRCTEYIFTFSSVDVVTQKTD